LIWTYIVIIILVILFFRSYDIEKKPSIKSLDEFEKSRREREDREMQKSNERVIVPQFHDYVLSLFEQENSINIEVLQERLKKDFPYYGSGPSDLGLLWDLRNAYLLDTDGIFSSAVVFFPGKNLRILESKYSQSLKVADDYVCNGFKRIQDFNQVVYQKHYRENAREELVISLGKDLSDRIIDIRDIDQYEYYIYYRRFDANNLKHSNIDRLIPDVEDKSIQYLFLFYFHNRNEDFSSFI
jgi:hypothetical protein